MQPRWGRRLATLIALAAVAGCSGSSDDAATGGSAGAAPTTERLDGAARPPSAPSVDEPAPTSTGPVFEPAPSLAPFEPQPTTPSVDGEDLDDVLRAEQTTTTSTTPSASGPDTASDAPVRPVALDAGPLAWTLRRPADAADSTIHVLVDERGCDGALAIEERLDVTVEERSDVIAISVGRRAVADPERAPCPIEPFAPLAIDLAGPIGERRLLDGSSGAVPDADPADDAGGIIAFVVGDAGGAAAGPATSVTIEASFAPVVDCTGHDRATPIEWRPTLEFADPQAAIQAAIERLDRSADVFHEFVSPDRTTNGERVVWVSADGGRVAATITARLGVVGWRVTGLACSTGVAADDARIDAAIGGGVGTPTDAPPLLDLARALTGAEAGGPIGEAILVDGTVVRLDGATRCPGWTALEDALLSTGHRLGPPRSFVAGDDRPVSPTGATPVAATRQVERRIDAPDGSAAVVATSSDGVVVVRPAAGPASRRPSRLEPCRLDGDSGSIQIVATAG